MLHIIIISIALSLVHASIPNHWLPLVAVGKAEHWDKNGTTLWATAISGMAHVSSTILIGILVGWAGYQFSASYHRISLFVAPAILILFGGVYLIRSFSGHKHHHHFSGQSLTDPSFYKVVFSLSIAMFFSPCIELESYYFTAGGFGWLGIILVSAVYLIITVAAMVLYVALAIEGINRFNVGFLEKNEKAIIGVVLIIAGIVSYFFNLH